MCVCVMILVLICRYVCYHGIFLSVLLIGSPQGNVKHVRHGMESFRHMFDMGGTKGESKGHAIGEKDGGSPDIVAPGFATKYIEVHGGGSSSGGSAPVQDTGDEPDSPQAVHV